MSDKTAVDKAIEWFFDTIQREDVTLTKVLRNFYSDGWLAGHTAGYKEGLEDGGTSAKNRMSLQDVYLQEKSIDRATNYNLYDVNDTVEFLKHIFGEEHSEGLDHVAEILYETASMVHTNPKAFDFSSDLPPNMEMKFNNLQERTHSDGKQYIKIYFSMRYTTGEALWVDFLLQGSVPSDFTKGIDWELF